MATFRTLVDDVDAALAFCQALGFQLADRWGPSFAIVQKDDVRLWLSGPGTSARRALDDGSMSMPGGWNRPVLAVPDLDAAIAGLQGHGARPRSRPVQGPGGRQVLVDDPSGNPIELFEAKVGDA